MTQKYLQYLHLMYYVLCSKGMYNARLKGMNNIPLRRYHPHTITVFFLSFSRCSTISTSSSPSTWSAHLSRVPLCGTRVTASQAHSIIHGGRSRQLLWFFSFFGSMFNSDLRTQNLCIIIPELFSIHRLALDKRIVVDPLLILQITRI